VEEEPFLWPDWPAAAVESARSVPGARESAEDDSTPGVVVSDATAMALCGLIFASVAARRADIRGRSGKTGGSPS
jgi:hypothetical protein